jgi:uncharacterized protein (DUF111 family)
VEITVMPGGQDDMDTEHKDDLMMMVETNIDDMPGEWMGFVLEGLLAIGAKDVFYTPIYMKKNRPAQKLSVLVATGQLEAILDYLFVETTTLGIRYYPVTCHRLAREFLPVTLADWGVVQVKVGRKGKKVVHFAPEYEDCAKIARASGLPLKKIIESVRREAVLAYPYLQ